MLYSPTQSKIKYKKFQEKEYFPFRHQGFATLAVHAGQEPEPIHGSVNVPIHLTSTYAQKDIAQPYGNFDYTRGGNPTREALEKCLAAVEYGKKAITFASGCGATATLLHTLKKGDHIIVSEDLYGGTFSYIDNFLTKYQGVEADYIDMIGDLSKLEAAIRPQTQLVWVESVSNPKLVVTDLEAICARVKQCNPQIKIIVDNTFCSPYICSPLLLGADAVMHSISKYVGGHADLLMGALVFKDEVYYKQVYFAAYSLGANPSPFDCYLALRGIKTLECRMIQGTCNAYHIAHFLEIHPCVESVYYPGLKSSKFHQTAIKQLRGFGAMVTFKIKGNSITTFKCLNSLKLIVQAASLGGVNSNICSPNYTSHKYFSPERRAEMDITENMVRLSVGTESLQDLIEDLDQALIKSQPGQ